MSRDPIIPDFLLQSNDAASMRMRSSEFDSSSEDGESVRLRQRLGKRESIFGIRNIFGRSNKKEGDAAMTMPSLTPTTSFTRPAPPSNIRASVAVSHWPHVQQNLSEHALLSPQRWDFPPERPDSSHRFPFPHGPPRRKSSVSATTWVAPPLRKAYDQSIRYDVLPAPTISADVMLRLSEKNILIPADNATANDFTGEYHQTSDMEKFKRRLRGDALAASSLQWTTKTYVLTTSGYLLQYVGEGSADRLPEKVLRLGSSSAAFASDIIPGRHWVLQISSVTENDGSLHTESRSLFSKLHLRASDRRPTTNMLMVFEKAEDMNEWITVLRSEIEKLGKKNLSRTEMSNREDGGEPRLSLSSTTAAEFDGGIQDTSMDDVSITNSIISHDGRQLDSLRESSQRFSQISSGQRTVMTSTNSSPAASPVLERFPRTADSESDAIPSRRTSLQAGSPFFEELRHDIIPENCPASYVSASPARNEVANGSAPVRRSFSKMAPSESEASSPTSSSKTGLSLFPRSSLRKQLATIRTSRPLSTVEDQPSPKENIPERPITSHLSRSRPSTPSDAPSSPRKRLMAEMAVPNLGAVASGSQGRKLPSFGALRRPTEKFAARKEGPKVGGEPATRQSIAFKVNTAFPPQATSRSGIKQRRRSLLELTDAAQGYTGLSPRAAKRASFGSMYSDKSLNADVHGTVSMELPPMLAPPPAKALPPIPQRSSPTSAGRAKLIRQSSSHQMPEGPPAPPPTCALPPIPQRHMIGE